MHVQQHEFVGNNIVANIGIHWKAINDDFN